MQRVRLLRTAALALCATALFVQSAAAFTAPLSLVSPHPARLRRGLGRRDRPPRPTMAAPTDLEGVYDFAHPGGTFDVHLRPGGRFFAPLFQARASWSLAEDQRLLIDFQKYGRYELTRLEGSAEFEGSAVGDPSNWRKMKRRRPFSEAEAKLLDSVWELQHPGMPCERVRALPDRARACFSREFSFLRHVMSVVCAGGSFPVEFRADGFNHFVSKDFPVR